MIRFCRRVQFWKNSVICLIVVFLFWKLQPNPKSSFVLEEHCVQSGWNISTLSPRNIDFGSSFIVSFANIHKSQKWIYLPKMKNVTWKHDILMLVVSKTKNFARRNVLRSTWMNKENSEMMKSGRMHALFFVGLVPGDQNLKKLVLEEAEIHGDMVVVDLEDTYDNLPFKTLALLLYGTSKASQFKIIGKIDDDVMFFPDQLLPMLDRNFVNSNTLSIYGHLSTAEELVLRNKTEPWYVPETAYNCTVYPVYVMGPIYLVTKDAASLILDNANHQQFMTVEDALITGIIAQKLGIRRYSLPNVFRHRNDITEGQDVLAWHVQTKNDSEYKSIFTKKLSEGTSFWHF
ncbi:Hexosyltransferase [Caenorhabditis elegans]|uniref:Hexosyltransferase n=1 Tax=Caenorhabditis elegans TaxID=6239 RepID=G5ECA6_CAEEL|nr:Hexosyltransferase [Caenorhabditis elegans]CAA15841.1 Hexosyltransferase [Caenorhabditis elegans]|eukprot:NP_493113.1 Hexosyltransferase [Caenorhabditis elegans]